MRQSTGLLPLCQNQAPQGNRDRDRDLQCTIHRVHEHNFLLNSNAILEYVPTYLSTYLPLPLQMAAALLAWCFVPLQALA
eukprot:COSAG06_NODE_1840_length_8239_cov_3.113145_11_plen_80_part_00